MESESYRTFLGEHLEQLKRRGISYRTIAKRCQIASPNFLQQVVRSQRNLTEQTARKIANGLKLKNANREYFLLLVRKASTKDPQQAIEITEKIQKQLARLNVSNIEDRRIYRSWLPGVIFESTRILGDRFSDDQITELNRHLGSVPEISRAVDTLIQRGCLERDGQHILSRTAGSINSGDDVEDINLQANHLRFLDLAKQHIGDEIKDREYQGLTLAIPRNKMNEVKEKIRGFLDDLDTQMSTEDAPDQLIHVQVSAFKLVETVRNAAFGNISGST